MDAIRPFHLDVPRDQLDDLAQRLDLTRWPERETVDDWSQGVPLSALQELLDHWRRTYDWRACEARLNTFGQYVTEIYGLDIHFLHVRSPHEHARPLILTHGWPGSVVEFLNAIPLLTDPAAHGGGDARRPWPCGQGRLPAARQPVAPPSRLSVELPVHPERPPGARFAQAGAIKPKRLASSASSFPQN